MSINIKNSDLYGSPIVEGKNNNIKINIQSSQKVFDWEMLQDELIKTSAKLPKESKEYCDLKRALNYAMAKDEHGLINFLKNNLSSFSSNMFTGVASGMLVELISSLIK